MLDLRERASRLDRLSIRQRAVRVLALAAVLWASAWVWPTVDAYGRATALVGDAVLRLPIRPLTWITPEPITEELRWAEGGTGVLVRPGGGGEHAGFVIMLGADPSPPDDPRVERLTDSLARIGFAALIVRSESLIDGQVTPDEVPQIVQAFQALQAHPNVSPEHVAMVGLSVGGSIEIVAAADPAIAEEVWFVFALGPYYDAGALTAMVTSRTFRGPDGLESWEPDEIADEVVEKTLLSLVDEADREAIEDGKPPTSPEGVAVEALLQRPPLEEAEAIVAGLPVEAQRAMDAVSPRVHLDGMRAPLYLLHDRSDPFIPWPESDEIAAAYEPEVYHRLDIFEHVDPEPANVSVMVRDGWKLLRLFASIIEDRP